MEQIIKTPAKINLYLYIGKKYEDGYHEIESVFQTISLFDVLIAQESKEFVFNIRGEFKVPVDNGNTILKTKELLKEKGIYIPNIHVTLIKNIPVGAGLGGGSSDAAGFIKLLRKFGVDIAENIEYEVLKKVGADCPFFIKGGSSFVRGRGEILDEIKLPSFSLVLIKPHFNISTKWAYDEFDKAFLTNRIRLDKISVQSLTDVLLLKKRIRHVNSFENVIFERYVNLRDISDYLWESGLSLVSLSGSGSSIFAVTKSIEEATEIGKKIEDKTGWRWWALQTTV